MWEPIFDGGQCESFSRGSFHFTPDFIRQDGTETLCRTAAVNGSKKCDWSTLNVRRFDQSTFKFCQPFPKDFYGFFTRQINEINPNMKSGNVPFGVPG